MKPIFAIDVTEDKNNEKINGEEFIVATISEGTQRCLEEHMDTATELERSATLPLWMQIVRSISLGYSVLYFVLFLQQVIENGFSAAMRNAVQNTPILLVLAFLGVVLTCVISLIGSRRKTAVNESKDTEVALNALDEQIALSYAELKVPEEAEDMDVLFFRYKMKDGEPVVKTVFGQASTHFNVNMKAYRTADSLMLADLEGAYAFPLSDLRAIRTVNKKISVHTWNKEEAPNEEPYKKYKLTVNMNVGAIFFKPYHILVVEHDGEEMGILFPPYELPLIERLTGLTAEAAGES